MVQFAKTTGSHNRIALSLVKSQGGFSEVLISLQTSTSSLEKIPSLFAIYFPGNEFLAQIRFTIK